LAGLAARQAAGRHRAPRPTRTKAPHGTGRGRQRDQAVKLEIEKRTPKNNEQIKKEKTFELFIVSAMVSGL
jgi:hypothetical protein